MSSSPLSTSAIATSTDATSQPDTVSTQYSWITLCQREDLVPGSGVAAWHEVSGKPIQVALFTLPSFEAANPENDTAPGIFAIDHHDPVSNANVMARGLLGDHDGEPLVISPLYKQRYRLADGQCLDNDALALQVWPVRVEGSDVQVRFAAQG